MSELNFNEFPNIGYISTKLPDDILHEVRSEVVEIYYNKMMQRPANDTLAGNIEKQFYLTKCRRTIEEFVVPIAQQYMQHWNCGKRIVRSLKGDSEGYIKLNFELDKLWVNFQKKHEFNPNHNHFGVFSFTSWLNIPYNLEDEMNLSHVKDSNAKATSCFAFSYTNSLGDIVNHPLMLDKSNEGDMIFFPAEMNHAVYPFYTSDDYRISIAGNVSLKV